MAHLCPCLPPLPNLTPAVPSDPPCTLPTAPLGGSHDVLSLADPRLLCGHCWSPPQPQGPSRLMQMVAPSKNFVDEETTSPMVRGLQSAALVKRRTQGQYTTSLHTELVPAPPWLVYFRTSAQGVEIIVSILGPLPLALAFVSFHSEWNGLASFR